MYRLFDFPVPLVAGLVSFQLPEEFLSQAPDYLLGAISAVFVTAYVLKLYGRLPGQKKEGFTEEHGRMLEKATDLLAGREGTGGFERFLKMNESVTETREILEGQEKTIASLAQTMESMESHMKVLSEFVKRSA